MSREQNLEKAVLGLTLENVELKSEVAERKNSSDFWYKESQKLKEALEKLKKEHEALNKDYLTLTNNIAKNGRH